MECNRVAFFFGQKECDSRRYYNNDAIFKNVFRRMFRDTGMGFGCNNLVAVYTPRWSLTFRSGNNIRVFIVREATALLCPAREFIRVCWVVH